MKILSSADIIFTIEDFLDNIEEEDDVLNFINTNYHRDFIQHLLYDKNIAHDLIRKYNCGMLDTTEQRVFCRQFLCSCYSYLDVIKGKKVI